MKNINYIRLFSVFAVVVLFSIQNLNAECNYDQMLRAEEFPIGIMLSWSTDFETNNSMFILEKSENGAEFQAAGTIRGAGTSKISKKYNFLDPQATGARIYYRLKQVDFDGTFSYSEVLSINKKLESNVMLVQLSSETVNKSFNFTVDAMKDGGSVLQIVDGKNAIVWQGTKMLLSGLNNISVDLSAQREGVYKVIVIMDNDEKSLTIRKVYDEIEKSSNVATDKTKSGKN